MALSPHVAIDIYNYSRQKVVNLYDSSLESPGQAFDIVHTNEITGWQELTFTLPYVMDGEYNHRWDYIKPDYKVCLTVGNAREWFFIRQPKGTRNSKSINRTVKCVAECDILKNKNIYAEFNDENGIGTLQELAERVLTGTGWTYDENSDVPLEKDGVTPKVRSLTVSNKPGAYKMLTTLCDLFKVYPVFDSDSHKVTFFGLQNRDIHREFMVGGASKDRADFQGGASTVGVGIIGIMIVGYDGRTGFLHDGDEAISAYGVTALSVEPDSNNVITRMFVEGQYGDDGYVGIDDATENETGLNYILNFDYYKEIGLFTDAHQAALDTYIAQMKAAVTGIREFTAQIARKTNELNGLWGQWNYVELVINNGAIEKTIVNGIENDDPRVEIKKGDVLLICGHPTDEYIYRYEVVEDPNNLPFESGDEYAVKFILASAHAVPGRIFQVQPTVPYDVGDMWWDADNLIIRYATTAKTIQGEYYLGDWTEAQYYQAAGTVGFKEMSVTAKKEAIKEIGRSLAIVEATIAEYIAQGLEVPQALIDERNRYLNEQASIQAEINTIYEGNDGSETGSTETTGLKQLTYEAMELRDDIDEDQKTLADLQDGQADEEETFVEAMGDLLKDGRWANNNYVVGQEDALYADALEISNTMCRPTVKYTVQRANLSQNLGYTIEDFMVNSQIRLWDPYLGINDLVYIKKITKYYDQPWKDTVEIANESEITISGKSLDATLQRIATLANGLDQQQTLYERAKAINSDGSIFADKLEGIIDLQRQKLESAISGWFTDDNGNIMFISADGQSAMKLTGEGFAVASSKNDDGTWNWRTFGTGKGFSADLIVTGLLNADLIEAGSITTAKLDAGVGGELDISANKSIQLTVGGNKTLQETLEDINTNVDVEIGGRNLIQKTLNPSADIGKRPCINGNANWEADYSSMDFTTALHGIRATKQTGSSSNTAPSIRFGASTPDSFMNLERGETYTFSADAVFKMLSGPSGSSKTADVKFRVTVKPTSGAPVYMIDKTVAVYETPNTVATARIEETFTVPTSASSGINIILTALATPQAPATSFGAGDYLELQNIQLEKGNKATDWSPAPEDFSAEISDVEAAVATKPTSFTTYFRLSTSKDNVLPVDGTSEAQQYPYYQWSTTAPAHQDGKYMWQKTVTTYTNLPDVVAGPTCIAGADGEQGESVTIVSQETMYAVGASPSTPPTTGWMDDEHIPTPTSTQYLWTRTTVTYEDGAGQTVSTEAYSVSKQGGSGAGLASITPQFNVTDTYSAPSQDDPGWKDNYSQVSYSYGQYLWIRNKIIKELDGQQQPETYSTPYCDPSWTISEDINVGADNLLMGTSNKSTSYTLNSNGYYFFTPIINATYSATDPTWTFDSPDDVGTGDIDQYIESRWYTFRVWIQNNVAINSPTYHAVTTYAAGIRVTNVSAGTSEDHLATLKPGSNGWQTVTVELPETGEYNIQAFVKRMTGSLSIAVVKSPKLELGNKATEWCPSSNELNLQVVQAIQDDLQDQIDGQVITWYYDVTPTASNPPANSWTTTALKEEHLGDTYYNSTDGKAYEWTKDDTVSPATYSWTEITISNVTKALADAHNAQTTADHKRAVFTTQPSNYDVGDLWVNSNGDIKYATRASDTYYASDWTQAANWGDIADSKIYAMQVEYRLSDSETDLVPPDAQATGAYVWNTVAPEWDGKFMWQRTGVKKNASDASFTYSAPTCISGAIGPQGKSVASVVNYYRATSTATTPSTTPITDWSTDVTQVALSSTNKYLWNFERTLDADSETLYDTTPTLLITWGQKNAAVSTISEQYRLSTGTTTSTMVGSWVTTPPVMTPTNRYLWNRERITYITGEIYSATAKIIGTYGTTISSIMYAVSNSGSTVPGDSDWQSSVPTVAQGEYLWTKITYSDGSIEYKVVYQADDGHGILSVYAQYAMIASKDKDDLSENDWVDNYDDLPPWQYGMYLWTRTVVVYEDSTEHPLEPSCDTSWEAIDDVEVDGDNLLYWTQRGTSEVYSESVNLTRLLADKTQTTRVNMLNVNGSDTPAVTQWVVFRTFVSPINGSGGATSNWKATIRFYPTNGGTADVTEFTVGKGTVGIQGSGYVDFVVDPATTGDNGWATVTVRAPSYNFEIEAWIIKKSNGEGDAVIYASPKLEFGMIPTQWCKNAQEVAVELAYLNTVASTNSQSIFDMDQDVTRIGNQYQELNAANGQLASRVGEVETTAGQIQLAVGSIQEEYTNLGKRVEQYETRVVIDPEDGLTLKQSQNPAYVARLKADHLEFINSNDEDATDYDPVASFGADGALIDRVQSRESLSVGTEQYGWFEMVIMKHGLADKWRDGKLSSKDHVFISMEPEIVYISDSGDVDNGFGADVTFEIGVEGPTSPVPTYVWQYRYLSDTSGWAAIPTSDQGIWDDIAITQTATGSTLTFASTMNHLGMEFRCVVNGTMNSRPVRYFVTGAPSIGLLLPANEPGTAAINLSCCAYGDIHGNYNPSGYLWEYKTAEDASWSYFANYEPWTHRTVYIEPGTISSYNMAFIRCVAYCDNAPTVTNELRVG